MKYGVAVPRSVKQALQLDKNNGNELWMNAIAKEISALLRLGCQENCNWNPKVEGYQYAPIQLVFNIKPDKRRKCCIVAGRHVIKTDLNSYASTV